MVLAAVLTIAVAAILGGGAGPTVVTPSDPRVTAGPATAQPGVPGIGEVTLIPLAAGPGAHDAVCTVDTDTGCATDIMAAFGSVWTTATDRLVRLDADTGAVLAGVPIEGHPIRMAADGRSLWVSTRGPASVVRIDPASNEIAGRFELRGLPAGIAVGHDSLWVVDESSEELLRLDPADGAALAEIPVGAAPWEVAIGPSEVWVTDRWGGRLSQVDPSTDEVTAEHEVAGGRPSNFWAWGDGVVTDGAAVFVASNGAVSRYEPGSQRFFTRPARLYSHLGVHEGRLWSAAGTYGLVEELDPVSLDAVASQVVPLSSPSLGGEWETSIAVTEGAVWLRSYGDDEVVRIQR